LVKFHSTVFNASFTTSKHRTPNAFYINTEDRHVLYMPKRSTVNFYDRNLTGPNINQLTESFNSTHNESKGFLCPESVWFV